MQIPNCEIIDCSDKSGHRFATSCYDVGMNATDRKKRRLPRPAFTLLVTAFILTSAELLIIWLPYHREQTTLAEMKRVGDGPGSE